MEKRLSNNTWYDDIQEMQDDDTYLQKIYNELRTMLSEEAANRTQHVHVYPSKKCTYTLDKCRVFVRVWFHFSLWDKKNQMPIRDDDGKYLPVCAIHHILLHELAHTVNENIGHTLSFWNWMRKLGKGIDVCPNLVPKNFNPCH